MPVPEGTSRDVRVLAAVLAQMLRGQRVSAASVHAASELAPRETETALARLDAAGVLYLVDGMVQAAYPFSGVPTRHRLNVGGATAYANCAIDALAVPFMVDGPVRIESACAQCGEPVRVQMSAERVVEVRPAVPVVVYVAGDCCEPGPAVLTRCPSINFFCGDEHASRWQAAHPELRGRVLPLAEAIAWSRERFALIIRLVRGDDVPAPSFSRYVQWLASRRD